MSSNRPVARRRGPWSALRQSVLGVALLAGLLLPPVRQAMESSMTLHMLVQYPAWLAAGALIADALPRRWRLALQRWNVLGIAGLLTAALTMAVLMVPRVLDLALVDLRVETLKLLALTCSGLALRISWRPAGTVVQAFFLGNVLPMLAVAGTLYQDSTTRLCNAYLLDDQQTLGAALIGVSIGIVSMWLMQLTRRGLQHPGALRGRGPGLVTNTQEKTPSAAAECLSHQTTV